MNEYNDLTDSFIQFCKDKGIDTAFICFGLPALEIEVSILQYQAVGSRSDHIVPQLFSAVQNTLDEVGIMKYHSESIHPKSKSDGK